MLLVGCLGLDKEKEWTKEGLAFWALIIPLVAFRFYVYIYNQLAAFPCTSDVLMP